MTNIANIWSACFLCLCFLLSACLSPYLSHSFPPSIFYPQPLISRDFSTKHFISPFLPWSRVKSVSIFCFQPQLLHHSASFCFCPSIFLHRHLSTTARVRFNGKTSGIAGVTGPPAMISCVFVWQRADLQKQKGGKRKVNFPTPLQVRSSSEKWLKSVFVYTASLTFMRLSTEKVKKTVFCYCENS